MAYITVAIPWDVGTNPEFCTDLDRSSVPISAFNALQCTQRHFIPEASDYVGKKGRLRPLDVCRIREDAVSSC